jgi:hypothetical protein
MYAKKINKYMVDLHLLIKLHIAFRVFPRRRISVLNLSFDAQTFDFEFDIPRVSELQSIGEDAN